MVLLGFHASHEPVHPAVRRDPAVRLPDVEAA